MRKTLIVLFATLPVMLAAQGWLSKPVSVSVFNNATMLPPHSAMAVFNQLLHPGFNLSYEFGYDESRNGKLFQDISAGYFYQQLAYQAALLYTRAGYRHYLGDFSAEASLLAGYMHLFLLTDRLVYQSDGSYIAEKGIGKPQLMAGAGIGGGYNFGTNDMQRQLFIRYDFRIQGPFVKSYTPVLPSGVVSIGFLFNIENNRRW